MDIDKKKRFKIFIVDDVPGNIQLAANILKKSDYDFYYAENGKKALSLVKQHDFDLILLDIMMPEMDGYEVIRRIREQVQFQGLPVLALTAKAMKGDREKCIAAGASDYLSKPVDADRLFSMLRVWLYR